MLITQYGSYARVAAITDKLYAKSGIPRLHQARIYVEISLHWLLQPVSSKTLDMFALVFHCLTLTAGLIIKVLDQFSLNFGRGWCRADFVDYLFTGISSQTPLLNMYRCDVCTDIHQVAQPYVFDV